MRKRNCTPRCWDAKGKKCRCICEGRKHGSGADITPDYNYNPKVWTLDYTNQKYKESPVFGD